MQPFMPEKKNPRISIYHSKAIKLQKLGTCTFDISHIQEKLHPKNVHSFLNYHLYILLDITNIFWKNATA
jgi:hypothetical protein